METGKSIKIIIDAVNNTQQEITISDTLTGYQLKQYIKDNVCDSLGVLQMKLFYAGVKIENDKPLSYYKCVTGSKFKILQSKIQLDQIPGLIVAYEQDQISLQTTTARMPCGHVIGRDCMTQFIRSLVQQKLYKIVCPSFKPNGERCQMQWDYCLCRKIGVFTKQEIQQFQTGLSKNYIMNMGIQCPNCHEYLFKGNFQHNRVICPKCKHGDFCSCCLKKWNHNGFDICGNSDCKGYKQFLAKSPWDKKFQLKQNGVNKTVYGPRYRTCPYQNCGALIQIKDGCKHMKCQKCQHYFCWVCLCLKGANDWTCGSFNTYCGKVAQTQCSSI